MQRNFRIFALMLILLNIIMLVLPMTVFAQDEATEEAEVTAEATEEAEVTAEATEETDGNADEGNDSGSLNFGLIAALVGAGVAVAAGVYVAIIGGKKEEEQQE